MPWEDVTTDTYIPASNDGQPYAWLLDVGQLQIFIHRYLGKHDTWFLDCRELAIDDRALAATGAAAAKEEALVIVETVLKKHLRALRCLKQAKTDQGVAK